MGVPRSGAHALTSAQKELRQSGIGEEFFRGFFLGILKDPQFCCARFDAEARKGWGGVDARAIRAVPPACGFADQPAREEKELRALCSEKLQGSALCDNLTINGRDVRKCPKMSDPGAIVSMTRGATRAAAGSCKCRSKTRSRKGPKKVSLLVGLGHDKKLFAGAEEQVSPHRPQQRFCGFLPMGCVR
jgi:hypothetical protein